MNPVDELGRGHRLEVLHIRLVHAEDEVESAEIGRHDAARLLRRDVDAMACRDVDGARVGRRSQMPSAGAGGIDDIGSRDAALRRDRAEDAFCQRRAADIAEADEKDAQMWLRVQGRGAVIGHVGQSDTMRRRLGRTKT